MAGIVKRRTGKGYEREIQTLTRLRTAIVLDRRIDVKTHQLVIKQIDDLIQSVSDLIEAGLNIPDKPLTQ